jgi:hypothetical protein
MVDKLSVLTSYTREFVRKCNRLLNDASDFYEPDTEESAIWANLCGVVQLAEDTLIDIAANPTAVTAVDFLNQWGLVAIGLGLMLGALARSATIAGVVLLALYWIVAPPFAGATYTMPAEGSYVLVNKVLVELGALLVVWAFPTSRVFGLDRYLVWTRTAKPAAPVAAGT